MKPCEFEVALHHPLFLTSSSCVIGSEQIALDTACQLKPISLEMGLSFTCKWSYNKANCSFGGSFRGPGIDISLRILTEVKRQISRSALTGVHNETEIMQVACVVDVLQTPALLARKTHFIRAVAQSGNLNSIKKGQCMVPEEMKSVIEKARADEQEVNIDLDCLSACERGVSFGYNNLVPDMSSLMILRDTDCPIIYDATHSLRLQVAQATTSRGSASLSRGWRAAVAADMASTFMETPPRSDLGNIKRPKRLAAFADQGTPCHPNSAG